MKSLHLIEFIGMAALAISVQSNQMAAQATQGAATPEVRLGKVEGLVTDHHSHDPLVGAIVTWRTNAGEDDDNKREKHNRQNGMQGSTDVLGRFSFAIPLGGREDEEDETSVLVAVRANGYHPRERSAVVRLGKTTRLDLELEPEPADRIGVVTGKVTNQKTGQGIPEAEVKILDAGAVLQATTDDSGTYSIPGVGFHSGLMIRMSTPSESDVLAESSPPACFVPIQRTFNMDDAVVQQNFAGTAAVTNLPSCPDIVIFPADNPVMGQLSNDDTLQWKQADIRSIQTNSDNDAWNSGHINGILKLDTNGGFLLGSDTGGIWAVTTIQTAVSLSRAWDAINISSLVYGPGQGRHVYAGTWPSQQSPGGVLWETDTSSIAPLLSWSKVNPLPGCGTINKILIITEVNRIVLACDNGLWWSDIPPAPSVKGTYVWSAAVFGPGVEEPPAPIQFSGLAKGSGWIAAAAGSGTIVTSANGGIGPRRLIYNGSWINGNLVLSPGAVFTVNTLGRTTVASCPSNPAIQYLLAADSNGALLAGVWRSADNGNTWAPVMLPNNAGNQGWYNQDIAVSPADCNTVAVAFRTAGPFISTDGGQSYTTLNDGAAGHQHGDLHALLFDPDDPTTLYVGSDGGMLAVRNVTSSSPTFQSNYNKDVLDLQMFHTAASTQANGLLVTALQDNGTDGAYLPPAGTGEWHQFFDSDGVNVKFITPGGLPAENDIAILTASCCGSGANWSNTQWNGTQFSGGNVIPVATGQNPRDPTGVGGGPVARVRAPNFINGAGQLMYAVAGLNQNVYGLFANDDGSDLHWELLGTGSMPDNVTSVSSFNGSTVFAGTDQLHIFELDAPFTGTPTSLPINNPDGPARVTSLAEFTPGIGFATLNSGFVLGWLGQIWNFLNGAMLPSSQSFNAVALPDLGHLIAITPTSVYTSHDLGTTWATANIGLPTIPQGTDLDYAVQPDGTPYLYMATFGWSAWRTILP